MTAALTVPERRSLAHNESIIARGQKTFVEVGNALAAIRDGKLYRADFATFSAYCEARWNFKRNYANKLIASAAIVPELGTNVPTPSSEAVAREVARVPAEKRAEVWEQAVERGKGKPTAATVRKVSEELFPPCPTCGGTAINEDGDCVGCHEPRVEREEFDEAVEQAEHTDAAEWLYLAVKTIWEEDYPETPAAVMAVYLENIAQRIRQE